MPSLWHLFIMGFYNWWSVKKSCVFKFLPTCIHSWELLYLYPWKFCKQWLYSIYTMNQSSVMRLGCAILWGFGERNKIIFRGGEVYCDNSGLLLDSLFLFRPLFLGSFVTIRIVLFFLTSAPSRSLASFCGLFLFGMPVCSFIFSSMKVKFLH